MPSCPSCGSQAVVKNGFIHKRDSKSQVQRLRSPVRRGSQTKLISQATKDLIDKLWLEKIPLAGITRVCDVSETWLQEYANRKYESIHREVKVSSKKKERLTIQCDEMWSFVGDKGNKQWIWLALEVNTREVIGVHIGDRSEQVARALWASIPSVYRQRAVAYTDFWSAYALVFPDKHHNPVGKETGKPSSIERLNCTMRQRVARLVRKTLSFSKKLENHIGAIWLFVHYYNSSLHL